MIPEYDSEVPYSSLRAFMMREREIPGRNTWSKLAHTVPVEDFFMGNEHWLNLIEQTSGNRTIRHNSKDCATF